MKTYPSKLKILGVGNLQTSITPKNTTRKVILTVGEIDTDNPFGHSKEAGPPFEVEVYNHNIENFNINSTLVGEIAHCHLEIKFYKPSAGADTSTKFIVNDLEFRL